MGKHVVGAAVAIVAAAVAVVMVSPIAGASPSGGSWRSETLRLRFAHPIEKSYRVGPKRDQFGDRLVDRYGMLQSG